MTWGRLNGRAAREYFNRLWLEAVDTPWGDIQRDEIERRKVEVLRPHLGGARTACDLGCGGGAFLSGLLQPVAKLHRCIGVDVAQRAVELARETGAYALVHEMPIDEAIEVLDERFDLVMLSEVLYYMSDYQEVLDKVAARLVRPGGVLFVSVAMGLRYFRPWNVWAMRRLLRKHRFTPLADGELDYRILGVLPRRYIPLYQQTHKRVLVYRAPL